MINISFMTLMYLCINQQVIKQHNPGAYVLNNKTVSKHGLGVGAVAGGKLDVLHPSADPAAVSRQLLWSDSAPMQSYSMVLYDGKESRLTRG